MTKLTLKSVQAQAATKGFSVFKSGTQIELVNTDLKIKKKVKGLSEAETFLIDFGLSFAQLRAFAQSKGAILEDNNGAYAIETEDDYQTFSYLFEVKAFLDSI